MELVTLACTVPSPSPTRVGKRISEPPPAMELIPPASSATPAAMRRSTADTNPDPTVGAMSTSARARALLVLLGASGVLHLVRPRVYQFLVPPELGPARPWVLGSGVAELGTAALLAVPATRRAGGWAAAARLTAFVPAHLHTFRVVRGRPGATAIAVLRLPLQVPLVQAALQVARRP